MTSAPIELFWITGSPFSWRVLLAFEAKKIAYTSRLLQASKGELRQPEFLALNPRGKVPTLRDGDFVVHESLAIMQYLDAKFPSDPLFGRTAHDTAAIWGAISEFLSYLERPIMQISVPLTFGQSEAKASDIRAAQPEIHAELGEIDAALENKAWLAGAGPTAADVTVYPFLKLLLRVAAREEAQRFDLGLLPFERSYPRLALWMGQVEQLPGYQGTYPPHWQQ
jgi:glutathione S-transferase